MLSVIPITAISSLPHVAHHDIPDCGSAHCLSDTSLVECSSGQAYCQWTLFFGHTRFCKHPYAARIAESTQLLM